MMVRAEVDGSGIQNPVKSPGLRAFKWARLYGENGPA